ncbi:hypothetical protein [Nocardioides stalactiti]|uniref:hypothetical protein n=1 Tax=Nocardioides stalactiti TaxID=2755356 RepID=UPI0015FF98B0|nr:hypothetical protein [Nocardioides stalactiti]
MTDQRLRELLEERVADVTTIDLGADAWSRASAVRRSRRTAAFAAVAAVAVVAVVGATTAVVTGGDDNPAPPPPATSPTESAPGPKAERAGTYGGVPVWWAPPADQEADLPRLTGSELPERIDLSARGGGLPAGIRAVALFQVDDDRHRFGEPPEGVVVLGSDGVTYAMDASRVEPISIGSGNYIPLPIVSAESLSPDGRYAFFLESESLEIYDFGTATWTTLDLGRTYIEARWQGDLIEVTSVGIDLDVSRYTTEGRRVYSSSELPESYRGPTRRDEPYGRVARLVDYGAQARHLAGSVTTPDGAAVRGVDAVAAGGYSEPDTLLAMPFETGGGRWNQCCPVVGWLDLETVLFESRHDDARVLAWRVGTPDLFQVSEVVGWTPGEESYVASFAALD